MLTTDPRADELLADRIMRCGGQPEGAAVLETWGLLGGGRRRVSQLRRNQWLFASAILETRQQSLARAVLDLMDSDPLVQAAFVSTAGAFRDFLAAGFPVAGMHGRTLRVRMFVGWDDRRRQAVSTVGVSPVGDLALHQLVALTGSVGWHGSMSP